MYDLKNAIEWSKAYKMQLHYGKTTCMLVGTRQRLNMSHKLNIQVNDTCIQNVSEQKLLGIYIDESLTWSLHIDYLCSHISTKILLLRNLSKYVLVKELKMFYQSYILPCIDYGSRTWRSASSLHIERLNKLQKRPARIILRTDFNTPSQEMLQELGWSPVPNRIKQYSLTEHWIIWHQLISQIYWNRCHRYIFLNLRSSENSSLYVPKSRTSLYSGSFSCSALRLWNALPQCVREAGSPDSFKKKLKNNL